MLNGTAISWLIEFQEGEYLQYWQSIYLGFNFDKRDKKISEYWKLPLVEDCAEALGSWTEGVHCGLIGDIGTLSFNGNKILTTGGGGAIITKNPSIAKRARHPIHYCKN